MTATIEMNTPEVLTSGATAIAPADYGDAWAKAHRKHIGSSDAAAACNKNKYRQPFDVYNQKITGISVLETRAMQRGKRYEQPIAMEYADRIDEPLVYPMAMYEHPALPFVAATPDAAVVEGNDPRLVEIKLCNWHRARALGEEETDEIFDDWLIQCQHQLWVTGFDVVDVFVCLDPSTHKLFRVERNDTLIDAIEFCETRLWKQIKSGFPPPIDFFHESSLAIAEAIPLREQVEPETLDDVQLQLDCCEYLAVKKHIKKLEAEEKALKARIKIAIDGRRAVDAAGHYTITQTPVDATEVPAHTRKGYSRLTVKPTKV